MRKFLYRSFIFSVASALASCLALVLLNFTYWDRRIPVIKKAIFDSAHTHVSVVLGSSHAMYGINCTLLDGDFYNLSSVSQSLHEDYTILKYFKFKKIKGLILPLSYFSNHLDLAGGPEGGETLRIFDYEHAYHAEYGTGWRYFQNKMLLVTQFANYLVRAISDSFDYHFDQYGTLVDSCANKKYDVSNWVRPFNRHRMHLHFERRNPYLDSIITYCAKNEIHLNIVVFPFTKGYTEAIANSNAGFGTFLKTLKNQESTSLKIIDCRDLFQQDEELYFRDPDHLSACGRDSLSRYLRGVIIR